MNWSKTLHYISVAVGLGGIVMLFGAWQSHGLSAWGMTEAHLFNDAQTLVLVAIWLNISTLVHQRMDGKSACKDCPCGCANCTCK